MINIPAEPTHELLDRKKVKKPKAEIHIIRDQCKGCGYCIDFCPQRVLERSEKLNKIGAHYPYVENGEKCTLCDFCSIICPDFAIFVIEKRADDGAYDQVK